MNAPPETAEIRSISSSSECCSPSGVVTFTSRSASSTPNENAAARLPPPENVTTTKSLSELASTPGASTGAVSGTICLSGCSRVGVLPQAANMIARAIEPDARRAGLVKFMRCSIRGDKRPAAGAASYKPMTHL